MVRKRSGRAGNHEGSIYYVSSQGLYGAAVTGPDGKRTVVSTRTRQGAHEKMLALQSHLQQGLPTPSAELVGHFLDWWLETLDAKALSGDLDPKTVGQKRGQVETWIKPAIGSIRLRDLSP